MSVVPHLEITKALARRPAGNCFKQRRRIVRLRDNAYPVNINNNKKEMFMPDTVTLGKRLVPVEQIVLIEPFDPSAHPRMQTHRPFRARVVLRNRDSILTEEPPKVFAEAHAFRSLPEDGLFTNPEIHFSVEVFHPEGDFNPDKPYQSRLLWRDFDGNTQSKLLLTKPEDVLAIAVRGELKPVSDEAAAAAGTAETRPKAGRRRSRRQAPSAALAQG
jgi:hypothetical protein